MLLSRLTTIGVCLAATLPLLAQDAAALPPRKGWVGGVIVILLFLVVVATSIKSSKRSHQD